MSRDYKKTEPKGRAGTMLLGVFIGLVLGLAAALAIAFYLNRSANPFLAREAPTPSVQQPGKAPVDLVTIPPAPEPAQTGTEGRPRFDFYEILPGIEQPASVQDLRERSAQGKAEAQDRYFLQAGAFQSAQEADNLKARIALVGLEATIQTANLGDKGIWHRVRLGPFDDADTLARVRSQLAGNGIDAAPIKVREKTP